MEPGTIAMFGSIGAVGVMFAALAYNALRDIRLTTNKIQETVQDSRVHLAKINGSIAETVNDLAAHIKDDEKTETRIADAVSEIKQSVQNIWAKVSIQGA